LTLDIITEDDRRYTFDIVRAAESVYDVTLLRFDLNSHDVETTLAICDDARIAGLNARFRGKSEPTNVLCWPTVSLGSDVDGALPVAPRLDPFGAMCLGDIMISYDTCDREAQDVRFTVRDHFCHLMIHGLLHLLGYDHVRCGDASLMVETETQLLGRLGIRHPYGIEMQ